MPMFKGILLFGRDILPLYCCKTLCLTMNPDYIIVIKFLSQYSMKISWEKDNLLKGPKWILKLNKPLILLLIGD